MTYHKGVGRGAYWFMGGPGVDPHWNGTAAEAYKWGAQQAARALVDIANGGGIDYPVVWMDIEIPGIGPATDNGWNTVYTTPCSGKVKQQHILASIDRADFNGFYDYVLGALQVPAGRLLRRRGVELGLRQHQRQPGQPRLHPEHRRVDVRAGDHQLQGQLPDRLLPEVGRVRAVLRRRHPVEQPRPHGSGPAAAGQTNGIGGFNGDLDQIDGARHPSVTTRNAQSAIRGSSRMSGCSRCTWASRHLSLNRASRVPSWRRASTSTAR